MISIYYHLKAGNIKEGKTASQQKLMVARNGQIVIRRHNSHVHILTPLIILRAKEEQIDPFFVVQIV